VFTGVKPCERTVAAAADRPSPADGCEVNPGSVAVRVVDASVPPLAGLAVEVAVEVVDGVVCTGELGACAAVVAVLPPFELDPHAESAAAHPASASHPIRCIGLIVRCAPARSRRLPED
jgi:hypothetical protein